MLLGPHDEAYYELRARIGRMHVRIALPQAYMFTAMDRIRVRLLDVLRTKFAGDPDKVERIANALNQIMDLELAIMLETYREDLETKHRNAERLATIGQFAASIGHELRNPLGVVESSLYLVRQHLGEQVAAQPQVAKHLDRIGSEVQRANRTIHDLLDLARNRPPRRHRTGLRALVESAAEAALLPAAITLEVADSAGPDRQHRPGPGPADPGQPADQRRPGACAGGATSGWKRRPPPTGARVCACATTVPAFRRRIGIASSRRCTRRRRRGAASGSRSAAGSWRRTKAPSSSRPSAAGASFLLSFPLRKADDVAGAGGAPA